MIAKGVRFNAEKKQVGNYYSTKIWSFKMKAACCKQEIEIQTDPKNCEYVVVSGAEKKTEDYDEVDAETVLLPAAEDRGKLVDPFYQLEHMGEDVAKGKQAAPLLVRLQRSSDLKHSDNYARNKALRADLRAQKKRVANEEAEARKKGLGIRLLPVTQDDITQAANVAFSHKFDINRRNKRAAIHAASIFSTNLTEQPYQSAAPKSNHVQKLDLLAKRRKLDAAGIRDSVCGKFKPSSRSKVERNMQLSTLKPSVKIKLA